MDGERRRSAERSSFILHRSSLILALLLALPALAAPKERVLSVEAPRKATVRERTVTIDVKDAEIRPLLKTMQRQCGIKNLVIDPNVQGGGATFLFRDVPCRQAFDIVFRTFGLSATSYPHSIVTVGARR